MTNPCCAIQYIYIFIEHITMQQHYKKFTMVNSFSLLFRPLSEIAPFGINPYPANMENTLSS